MVDVPEYGWQRPPLPKQHNECKASEQHIGAALDRLRHEPRPPFFEGWPRHHAVLDREQRQQNEVDDQRFRQRRYRTAVDRLRYWHVADKGDGIEEGNEEDGVSGNSVEQCDETAHGILRWVDGLVLK